MQFKKGSRTCKNYLKPYILKLWTHDLNNFPLRLWYFIVYYCQTVNYIV